MYIRRVSVPIAPNTCTGGNPNAPIRVNRCCKQSLAPRNLFKIIQIAQLLSIDLVTSCESGTYFNTTDMSCQACEPGTYSTGGGLKIVPSNESLKKYGFRIKTESKVNYMSREIIGQLKIVTICRIRKCRTKNARNGI